MGWRDWIIVGIFLLTIMLLLLGAATPDRKQAIENIQAARGLFLSLLWLVLLIFSFADWRHGLMTLGLSNVWSWVVAPVGSLIVLFGALLAAFAEGKDAMNAYFLFGILAVAYGGITYGPEYIANMFG